MSKWTKLLSGVIAFAIFVLGVFVDPPGHTQERFAIDNGHFFDDSSLASRFDFIITVKTEILKDYMAYPGSTLKPITQCSITYKETGRLNKSKAGVVVKYEELWYHDCNAIGCRRYNLLKIEPGEQGIIRFLPSYDANRSACAIANVSTRLLLDIGLNHCALSAVSVPVGTISDVVGAFEKLNFLPFIPKPDTGVSASMAIYICSEPFGEKRYLYYSGSQL